MQLHITTTAATLQVDAVMLDLDGTLVNTLGDFAQALNRMLLDLALPAIDARVIKHTVGKGTEHLLRSVLAHVGVADVDARYAEAWQRYEHHYLQLNGQFSSCMPGWQKVCRPWRLPVCRWRA